VETIWLNGLNQRPGGGLVVLEALATGIHAAAPEVRIEILVMHDDSFRMLEHLRGRGIGVRLAINAYPLLDRFWPARLIAAMVNTNKSDCGGKTVQTNVLISLNHRIPGCSMTQIVYHVNLARFERKREPSLREELLQRLRDRGSKSALSSATANVFESEYVLEAAQRRYPSVKIQRPSVTYIGVDESHIVEVNSISERQIVPDIVAISSPNPHKRNEHLISLLVELRKLAPDVPWRVRLFGGHDQSVWAPLVDLAAEQVVSDLLILEGYQPREKVAEVLDHSLCLYSPSALESFCMVALEAMARACPAVVAEEPAMPESVGNAGLVVDANDAAAVAQAVHELWLDKPRRLAIGMAGLTRARGLGWRDSGMAFLSLCRESCAT